MASTNAKSISCGGRLLHSMLRSVRHLIDHGKVHGNPGQIEVYWFHLYYMLVDILLKTCFALRVLQAAAYIKSQTPAGVVRLDMLADWKGKESRPFPEYAWICLDLRETVLSIRLNSAMKRPTSRMKFSVVSSWYRGVVGKEIRCERLPSSNVMSKSSMPPRVHPGIIRGQYRRCCSSWYQKSVINREDSRAELRH